MRGATFAIQKVDPGDKVEAGFASISTGHRRELQQQCVEHELFSRGSLATGRVEAIFCPHGGQFRSVAGDVASGPVGSFVGCTALSLSRRHSTTTTTITNNHDHDHDQKGRDRESDQKMEQESEPGRVPKREVGISISTLYCKGPCLQNSKVGNL